MLIVGSQPHFRHFMEWKKIFAFFSSATGVCPWNYNYDPSFTTNPAAGHTTDFYILYSLVSDKLFTSYFILFFLLFFIFHFYYHYSFFIGSRSLHATTTYYSYIRLTSRYIKYILYIYLYSCCCVVTHVRC